jgi:hypothetical protein
MNFQTLEYLLRVYIGNLPASRPWGIPAGVDIYVSPVGTYLPENDLTSYDSLGQLIDKFNVEANKTGLPTVDRSLVGLRDALAHGRVSADVPEDTLRLLKFDKPQNGRVRVSFNEVMTEAWFKLQRERTESAVHIVLKQYEGLTGNKMGFTPER